MERYGIDIEKFNALPDSQKWTMLLDIKDEDVIIKILSTNKFIIPNLINLLVNSNNKYDVGKLLKTLNINRQESILDKLISPKYYEVMISKGYHNELLKLIKENLEKYPETSNYLDNNMMKFINDKDFFISLFYLYIDKNVLIPSGLAKTIDEKDWINVFNKYSNDEDKIINIISNYCSAYENISLFYNKLNYDLFFKWILSYGSSIIYYDTLIEYVQNNFDNIKNINDNNLFVSIINQMIKVDDDKFKEKFLSTITRDMIERFNSNSEISLGKLCENQKINSDTLKFIKSEEEIFHKKQKEQEKRKEEEQKLIEESRKYLKDNDINMAWKTFVKINDKSKCKDLYMFFLDNEFINQYNFVDMYIEDEKLLMKKYIDKYYNKIIENYLVFEEIFNFLIEKKDDLAIYITSFDNLKKNNKYKTIENLMNLYNHGLVNEYIKELITNYEKLKKCNNGLNYMNPVFTLDFLDSDLLEKYSPQFIVDVLEYNTDAAEYFITNKNSYELIQLESFLKKQGIYSRKNIQCILENFEKLEMLLNNLISNNIIFSEEEKNSFINYIYRLKAENSLGININTIYELRYYKFKKLEKINEIFEKEDKLTGNKIKVILFGNGYVVEANGAGRNEEDDVCLVESLVKNNYLLDRMMKKGDINQFDLALIEIIRNINQTNDIKKYWEICKKGISLENNYVELVKKIKNYYLNEMNEKFKNNNLSQKKSKCVTYNGKSIKIIDFDEGDKYTFLTTSLSTTRQKHDDNYGTIYEDLLNDPSFWNETDIVSSISCSMSSDKHPVISGGCLVLGFMNLPNDSLIGETFKDGDLSHGYNALNPHLNRGGNRFYSLDYFLKRTGDFTYMRYNEVGLYRKNNHLKKFDGKIQPSFVLIDNREPMEGELKFAEYFDIPIIRLNKTVYENLNQEKANNYRNGNITKFDIEDVKEILSLKEFSESESESLIFSYLDKLELPDDEYNKFIDEVREVIIDFYIHDANKIDQVLSELEQHRRVTFSQEDGYGRH